MNTFLVSSELEKSNSDSIGGNFEQLMLVEFGAECRVLKLLLNIKLHQRVAKFSLTNSNPQELRQCQCTFREKSLQDSFNGCKNVRMTSGYVPGIGAIHILPNRG